MTSLVDAVLAAVVAIVHVATVLVATVHLATLLVATVLVATVLVATALAANALVATATHLLAELRRTAYYDSTSGIRTSMSGGRTDCVIAQSCRPRSARCPKAPKTFDLDAVATPDVGRSHVLVGVPQVFLGAPADLDDVERRGLRADRVGNPGGWV